MSMLLPSRRAAVARALLDCLVWATAVGLCFAGLLLAMGARP